MDGQAEREPGRDERKNWILRITFSVIMVLAGALVAVLTEGATGRGQSLLKQIGLAFMIAGVVSLFTELVIARSKPDMVCALLEFTQRFQRSGMRMVCFPRKGYWRYHTWLLVNEPQDIFFAGRSVLHRIHADFDIRKLTSVEEAFVRKLGEGSKIKVLLCDPTWELLPQLADAEGQPEKALLSDLAISLGILVRLWDKIQGQPLKGELEIRIYRELVQYAYHYTKNLQTNQTEVLVGFYFAEKLGCRSPLFEADDEAIQSEFKDHFDNVFARATTLLEYPAFGHGKRLDEQLMLKCRSHLVGRLGEDTVRNLMKA